MSIQNEESPNFKVGDLIVVNPASSHYREWKNTVLTVEQMWKVYDGAWEAFSGWAVRASDLKTRADTIISHEITFLPAPEEEEKLDPKESDPNGLNQHLPGAKLDVGKLKASILVDQFPRSLKAVLEVATYGAEKYTRGGWLEVVDGRTRYSDAMYRHLLEEGCNGVGSCDPESKLLHSAHAAWNALARLELELREQG